MQYRPPHSLSHLATDVLRQLCSALHSREQLLTVGMDQLQGLHMAWHGMVWHGMCLHGPCCMDANWWQAGRTEPSDNASHIIRFAYMQAPAVPFYRQFVAYASCRSRAVIPLRVHIPLPWACLAAGSCVQAPLASKAAGLTPHPRHAPLRRSHEECG